MPRGSCMAKVVYVRFNKNEYAETRQYIGKINMKNTSPWTAVMKLPFA